MKTIIPHNKEGTLEEQLMGLIGFPQLFLVLGCCSLLLMFYHF